MKIAKLLKQNIFKIINPKKFVSFNKVVILKKNLSTLKKDYFIIQTSNNKDKILILR